ncbi:MAG: hypothetical protein O2826_03735 [Chloroflexi bacterium]|nr:hypothetical protein [Chloroflexota bacterium]MDA1173614.1 hypothetical protein [Chloroflexota bacterium]
MPDAHSTAHEEDNDLGYECHDCGEVYAPGASFKACTDDGHYVGKIQACALPIAAPASND